MQETQDALPIVITLAIYAVFLLIALGVQALICFLLYRSCAAIPENYRITSPGAAFVMMIPLVGLVWIFLYTKNLSNSFVNFFSAYGVNRDDCGEKLGLWWGICAVGSIVPCLGAISAIAAFVLMVMYLVKVSECRSQALGIATGSGTMGAAAPYKTPGTPQNPYGY